jgi:hypothetical protein
MSCAHTMDEPMMFDLEVESWRSPLLQRIARLAGEPTPARPPAAGCHLGTAYLVSSGWACGFAVQTAGSGGFTGFSGAVALKLCL